MTRQERYAFELMFIEETDIQKENIDKASNSSK